jgi:hypothetical protein
MPTVRTNRGCYLVGRRVKISGAGFAPGRSFDIAIDGVDFGQSATDSIGAFQTSLHPGGLPAGVAQAVEHLEAGDGTSIAAATFTLTRAAGARFLATSGSPSKLRAPFELWGFALDGSRRKVYVHYVSPAGAERETVRLGHTGGQCGYLRTPPRRIFPFAPSLGSWTLQVDTHARYSSRPHGPVARIRVQLRRG